MYLFKVNEAKLYLIKVVNSIFFSKRQSTFSNLTLSYYYD